MSREKQIKEIARVLCDAHAPCSKCVWGKCDVEHTAIRLYEAGYRKQEWISVEERLPDIDPHGKGRYGDRRSFRVLCACKQKGGKTFVKERYYEPCGNGRVWWRIPGSIDAVTHWMPLPEPPKGE